MCLHVCNADTCVVCVCVCVCGSTAGEEAVLINTSTIIVLSSIDDGVNSLSKNSWV